MQNITKPTPDPKPPPSEGPPMSKNPFDGDTGERPPWWTATQKSQPVKASASSHKAVS